MQELESSNKVFVIRRFLKSQRGLTIQYNTIQLLILPIGFFRTNLNVQEKKKKYKNVLKTYDVIVSTIL